MLAAWLVDPLAQSLEKALEKALVSPPPGSESMKPRMSTRSTRRPSSARTLTSPGSDTTSLRLIRSTGLGMAVLDGSGPQPWAYASRGNDLTRLNGNYYVAACVSVAGKGDGCSGTSGIFGFVPGLLREGPSRVGPLPD